MTSPPALRGQPKELSAEDLQLIALSKQVAHEAVILAVPVAFRLADSEADREAVFRLRCRTVVANGWAAASDFPDGLECDVYDDDAVHIVGWVEDELAATARLVFPQPGRPLPTEQAFELEIEPFKRVVDLGRGIVAPPYRDPSHRVLSALLGACWLEAFHQGFLHMAGDAPDSLLRVYSEMGLAIDVLGPARLHWGQERFPIHVDALATMRRIAAEAARSSAMA